MSTIADAMDAATAELRACRVAMDALRQTATDQLAGKTTAAQTVINNFINRAPAVDLYVDVNNGTDAAGFGALDKPFKSVDYALENRDSSVTANVFMFSDDVIKRYHPLYAGTQIVGVARQASANGLPYTFTARRLSFLAEGTDSPYAGIGRSVPYFALSGPYLLFYYTDIALPTPPSGVLSTSLIASYTGSVSVNNSTITVDTPGSTISLVRSAGQNAIDVAFNSVTLGQNVPGKLFQGVAAGQDPNAQFIYRSNLKSA